MSDTTSNQLPSNCAPWCEIRTMGIDPEEHEAQCVSPTLASLNAHDRYGRGYDVYSMVGRSVANILEPGYVRLAMDARGAHEGMLLLLSSGKARTMAAGLTTAADIAEGLRPFPGISAAEPLHRAARDLDALADTLPADTARRVREQAQALRSQGVELA
ncbi:hypothetical protein [Kocuria marina]|uniref:hypothetical protein n=1 Tax=Kocuria marina TaxID=223184 RepID=UPI0022E143C3|nr:hypothetical protein [Kocuria marina]